MIMITVPKTQYELLKKRSSLYQVMLRSLSRRKWGIEEYTSDRIREFMDNDQLDLKTAARLKRILKMRI